MTAAVGRTHRYEISLTWTGNRGTGTSGYRAYGRSHDVRAEGLPPIAGSADRAFHGDRDRWNPELELTAALSQCHLLSYLHVCATAGVIVTSYTDDARGVMAETADGGGRFTEVVLRPRVTVSQESMVEAALRLHGEASTKCFIASSVNFPVRHEPVVTVSAPVELTRGYGSVRAAARRRRPGPVPWSPPGRGARWPARTRRRGSRSPAASRDSTSGRP